MKLSNSAVIIEKGHTRSTSGPSYSTKLSTTTFIEKSSFSANNNYLDRLRRRKERQAEAIDPHIAAKVVKSYLVPMIKYKSSSKLDQSKLMIDLNLIERLQTENERLREVIININSANSYNAQQHYELQCEYDHLKDVMMIYESLLQCINFSMNQGIKHCSRLEKQLEYGKFHKTKSDLFRAEYIKKNKILSEALHEEKTLNNIRFIKKYFP